LSALSAEVGPDEVALAALFCGAEPARFAQKRARAEGRPPTLEELAAQLPPDFADPVALASQATTLGTAYALSWPVPEHTRVSSPFGVRNHPILGSRRMHTGVDLSVPAGTSVHATGPGVVARASEDAVNGRMIVVDHGRGVTTAYCHNDELLVRTGQPIERGAVIARSGNTGRSTGPHLHYQLGVGGAPVDPARYRRARLPMHAGDGLAGAD
jgi:murein DD-endopeptidase MepM/ murein hydrolase activator NlpD